MKGGDQTNEKSGVAIPLSRAAEPEDLKGTAVFFII